MLTIPLPPCLCIRHLFISASCLRASVAIFARYLSLTIILLYIFLCLPLLRRGLNGFAGCALFKSASIIPVLPPVSSGKRSGKLSGRAYFTPPSKEKRKAEPLVFQRDSAICENFSKKSVLSRKISRKCTIGSVLVCTYCLCQCISCWSNRSYSDRKSSSSS